MPAPIQRFPLGLLEFLGLKGVPTPSQLLDQVVPIIDMKPFFAYSQINLKTATAVTVPGGTITIAVPQGESWTVVGVNALIDVTVAVTALRATIRLGGNIIQLIEPSIPNLVSVYTLTQGFMLPYPVTFVGSATPIASVRLDHVGGGANLTTSVQVVCGVTNG